MAAVHTGAAEEEDIAGKLRELLSIGDSIQGLGPWFHLSSRRDVEHEEIILRMPTDRCRGAGIFMIHCPWDCDDHTKDVSGLERPFNVVVIPMYHRMERLPRAVLLDAIICLRTRSSNSFGEKVLADRLGCEVGA